MHWFLCGVWTSTCLHLLWAIKYLGRNLPSQQLWYSTPAVIAVSVRSRCVSFWDESSSFMPFFLTLLLPPHCLYTGSVFVPGFPASTGWLESHSGTVAPGQNKASWANTHFSFSYFLRKDGWHVPLCGYISVCLTQRRLIDCIQLSIVYTVQW